MFSVGCFAVHVSTVFVRVSHQCLNKMCIEHLTRFMICKQCINMRNFAYKLYGIYQMKLAGTGLEIVSRPSRGFALRMAYPGYGLITYNPRTYTIFWTLLISLSLTIFKTEVS